MAKLSSIREKLHGAEIEDQKVVTEFSSLKELEGIGFKNEYQAEAVFTLKADNQSNNSSYHHSGSKVIQIGNGDGELSLCLASCPRDTQFHPKLTHHQFPSKLTQPFHHQFPFLKEHS